MTGARVASLHLYPVKGCRRIDLARAEVVTTGLRSNGTSDREWMVVDGNGIFLTQRQLPRLALVSVAIDDGVLRLAAPYMRDCDVPMKAEGESRAVTVWN